MYMKRKNIFVYIINLDPPCNKREAKINVMASLYVLKLLV